MRRPREGVRGGSSAKEEVEDIIKLASLFELKLEMLLQLQSFLLVLFEGFEPIRDLALAFARDVGLYPLEERFELRSLHIIDVFNVWKVTH